MYNLTIEQMRVVSGGQQAPDFSNVQGGCTSTEESSSWWQRFVDGIIDNMPPGGW